MAVSSENLRFILGLKLRTLRQDRGASLKEIAEDSGLSISYLSEIEKGKKYPKPDKIIDLADALGVTYDDLVSMHVTDELDPIKEVFSSTFIQEFPFDVFGLEPQDVFALVSDRPSRAGALIRTFLEIGRTYDMQVEHFLFAALRSYQQLHGNYFEELEELAQDYRRTKEWAPGTSIPHEALYAVLVDEYGYDIDLETLPDHPELSDFRSVFVEGDQPTLLLNGDLMDIQRAFIYAREIGYCIMDVEERARTSSWLKVESYEQVLNNFRASYFAGALLIDRDPLLDHLKSIFSTSTWDPDALRTCMARFDATPEMFYYRLTELVPRFFGLEDIFFMRFHHEAGSSDFKLTKLLNMSQVPVPHGIGLREHYCRRWPAMRLLHRLSGEQHNGTTSMQPSVEPRIRAQRSYYLNDDAEFFVLSSARPLALQPTTNSCVSLGFLINDDFKRHVRFWNDDDIPQLDVNLTCERCPLTPAECGDRVASPTLHEADQSQRRREEALAELTEAVRNA
ncbi:XRE family transcriptional regulator [Longibacter salinarum]|uniref:XRE family transcriptional regulator n=1 Tax=Longibacter salinarum TaxID=1850348 RepID=A0A2A8CZE1_9BACT|nr:XRE family transcriptional regulator [Longibacter salinarum]PEN13994.1 XRE family transcriptional regulator [Longibacter salinarum]